jgi:hypothetical protein
MVRSLPSPPRNESCAATRAFVTHQPNPVILSPERARPAQSWRFDGFEVFLLRSVSAEWEEFERELVDQGVPLPLPHRIAWARTQPVSQRSWLLGVRDRPVRSCGAVVLQVAPSRALPGHLLLRVERFGPGVPAAARNAVLHVIAAIARRHSRILRVYIEPFIPDATERAAFEHTVSSLGFTRLPSSRSYERTLVLPLDRDEESILASFHRTARQNIRSIHKHPVRIAPIADASDFARLDELSTQTFARTGGRYDPVAWQRLVDLNRDAPSLSRLVGLYRTDVSGPESLVAFSWACAHGDHAHYSSSGSTRVTDRRIPLLYPLLWDMIRWARDNGARWFDFGGVTAGSQDSDDPLGGISDFKRYFTDQVVEIGGEWSLEPRPMRAKAARIVGSASRLLARRG